VYGCVVFNTQELQTTATVGSVNGCSVFSASGIALFWGQITTLEEISKLRPD